MATKQAGLFSNFAVSKLGNLTHCVLLFKMITHFFFKVLHNKFRNNIEHSFTSYFERGASILIWEPVKFSNVIFHVGDNRKYEILVGLVSTTWRKKIQIFVPLQWISHKESNLIFFYGSECLTSPKLPC